jgi:hypothetical protein
MAIVLNVVGNQWNFYEALFTEVCLTFVKTRNSGFKARLIGSAFFLVISHVETVMHQFFVHHRILKENFNPDDRLLPLFFFLDG